MYLFLTVSSPFLIIPYHFISTLSLSLPHLSLFIGSKLMPDFFLDEAEKYLDSSSSSSPPDINTPAGIFNSIRSMASEAIVKQMGATYLFVLSGENSGNWLLDLKTGSGSVQEVSEGTSADVTFTMDSKHMVELFQGKINATTAFMTGKLKISGNMGLAMKLDKLLGQVKSKL